MKNLAQLIIVLILFSFPLRAQEFVDIKNTGTCEKALDISRFKRFGPTTAPEAAGQAKNNSFQRPQHPTWYKFTVESAGVLLFDIIPNNPKDNYDFMLFADEPDFCKKYNDGKVTPLRYDYSPANDSIAGCTGLSFNGKVSGYAKGIDVKTGETYYLVLNNVYENGKGHSVVFKNLVTYSVSGYVLNQKNDHTVTAKVSLRNLQNPDLTTETETDKKGWFELKIGLNNDNSNQPVYELCAWSEKFFPMIKTFSADEIKELKGKSFDFQLSKLKKGYNIDETPPIYFMPNDLEVTPESAASLQKLLLLLSLNNKTEVILEGHTNGIYPSTSVDQQLSEDRCTTIKTYLTQHGIEPERIQTKGFGSTKEIYEMPENEEQEGFNRRVEINLIKF